MRPVGEEGVTPEQEIVNDVDTMILLEQNPRQQRSDIPGAAGD